MTTIVKATTKGQITLPARWRKKYKTDSFMLKEKAGKLEVVPISMEVIEKGNWEVVFNAKRDNKGKPLSGRELIKRLKSIDE